MLRELVLFSVLLCTSLAQDIGFSGFSRLSTSPQYDLIWNVTGNRINFVVIVETTGWVGFGISPNGLMLDSDVIMGCVDDSTAVVTLTVSGHIIQLQYQIYTHNVQTACGIVDL